VSAGGVPVFHFFEKYSGLVDLLSERSHYVKEWVRIFYSTVFVEAERHYIQFMFAGGHWRMTRDILCHRLGVKFADEPMYLHLLTYGDAEAPHHAHEAIYPLEDKVRVLFTEPFLLDTPRTPDRLTPVAYTIHMALRRSLLYRQGNNECIIALQQLLLIHILMGRDFDIVDLLICEIEDAIMDGMTV
jgi:hypothetical protein